VCGTARLHLAGRNSSVFWSNYLFLALEKRAAFCPSEYKQKAPCEKSMQQVAANETGGGVEVRHATSRGRLRIHRDAETSRCHKCLSSRRSIDDASARVGTVQQVEPQVRNFSPAMALKAAVELPRSDRSRYIVMRYVIKNAN
jgi:hypothetical protein